MSLASQTGQGPRFTRTRAVVACLVAGAVGGLGYLGESTSEHDGLARLDPRITAHIIEVRDPPLTALARTLTVLGSELVVGLLAIGVLVWLVRARHLRRAVVFAVGMSGSAVLTVAVKHLVGRPRPGRADVLGAVDHSYSFPSGHTLNSAVFVALVVWLLWSRVSRAARLALTSGAVVLTVGIGASRVYLGYHWFTDVLAAGLTTVAWLGGVWLVQSWLPDRAGAGSETSGVPRPLPR